MKESVDKSPIEQAAEEIEWQIVKHLNTLPYAGGYPSNWKETLALHLAKWQAGANWSPVRGDAKYDENDLAAAMTEAFAFEAGNSEIEAETPLGFMIKYLEMKRRIAEPKAAPKGDDELFHGLDPNILCRPLGEVLRDDVKSIRELYAQWCKETKRNGAILVHSIHEFFNYLDANQFKSANAPSEPTFTLKQGLDIWDDSRNILNTASMPYMSKEQYFKEKFNIDLSPSDK